MINLQYLICLLLPYCLFALRLDDRNESYNTPDISWMSKDSWGQYPITGELVLPEHHNVTDKIVIMNAIGGDWKTVSTVYKKGARGLVLFNTFFTVEGFFNYLQLNGITTDIPSNIPAVEVSYPSAKKIMSLLQPINNSYPSIRVTLFSDDINPWRQVNEIGSIWFSVIVGGLCIIAMILSSIKIYKITKNSGWKASTSLICLSIHTVANFLRFVYVVIDPIYSRHVFPKGMHDILATGLVSLSLTTTVLIAFYWQETLYKAKKLKEMKHQRVEKFLVPAIITLSILIIIDIGGGVTFAILDAGLLLIWSFFFAFGNFVSAIYLLITGALVLYRMSNIKQVDSKSMKIIRQITLQIMASAVLIIIAPQFIYLTTTLVFRKPATFYVFFLLYFIFALAVSIVQITAIRIRHPDTDSKDNRKSSSDNGNILEVVVTSPKSKQ